MSWKNLWETRGIFFVLAEHGRAREKTNSKASCRRKQREVII
jgi:hypothetical protein